MGAGVISSQYLATIRQLEDLQLTAVADMDAARAESVAAGHDAVAVSLEELVTRDDVDVVLNLTVPQAHQQIAMAAIEAGKGVYTEKPFTATVAEGQQVVDAAREAGVVVGGAPDTVLGTGVQTARAAVDAGRIGTPMSATATMINSGHEAWHPNPDFYYQPGGGPLLDMGPYYITSLMTLLGPVSQVVGAGTALRDERIILSGPRAGEHIPVNTPSHVTGVLIHASGAVSTLVMSFDGVATHAAPIEVQGTEGALAVPDPNNFAGTVLWHAAGGSWQEHDVAAGYRGASRGYGLADLWWEGAFGGDPLAGRCQGELGLHVLEVMEKLLHSAESGSRQEVTTTAQRPPAVPLH